MRYAIAFLLAAAGGWVGVLAMSQLSQGDPSTKLAGLILLTIALGLGFWSIIVLTGSKSRVVSLIATLVVAAVFIADIVFKCVGGDLPFCKKHALAQPRIESKLASVVAHAK